MVPAPAQESKSKNFASHKTGLIQPGSMDVMNTTSNELLASPSGVMDLEALVEKRYNQKDSISRSEFNSKNDISLDSNNTQKHSTETNNKDNNNEGRSQLCQSILAWLSMVLAILAASSIGPAFKYMQTHGVSACLAASWRCQCMTIFLVPLGILEVFSDPKKNKVDWFEKKSDLTFPVIIHVLISGTAWAGNLLFWVFGLQFTTTFKASLIASSHPILLVFVMKCKGIPVSFLEWLGVFVAFGGMVLSSSNDLFGPGTIGVSQKEHQYEYFGWFLCLLAAAAEVLVLFNRIATKKYVPLMQYTAATTVIVSIWASLATLAVEDSRLFCLQEDCVFGWMSHRWAFRILMFGLWIGVVCIAGFNYAMQYIPPLIFASCGLVDPAITAIISWMIGVEHLPALVTWIGGAAVMSGVGVITLGEHLRESAHKKEHTAAAAGDDDGDDDGVINQIHSSTTTVKKKKGSDKIQYSKVETNEDDDDDMNTLFEGDTDYTIDSLYSTVEMGRLKSSNSSSLSGFNQINDELYEESEGDENSTILSAKEQAMLRSLQQNIANIRNHKNEASRTVMDV